MPRKASSLTAPYRALPGFLLLALGACGERPEPAADVPTGRAGLGRELGAIREVTSPAGKDSSGPHLSAGIDGTVVLSWIEPIGDAFDNQLKFARWSGAGWGPAQTVASGGDWFVNAADVPAVQPIAASLWAAHWRVAQDDELAYDVMISVSRDAGATWTEPRLLNDDGTATEHGFVSLFAWDGDVGAVWLDGREVAGGEGFGADGAPIGTALRVARLAADGAIAEQGVLDSLVCDCCMTGSAQLADGAVLVYRDRTPDEIRDIVVRRHRDGRWSEPIQAGADHWRIEGCPINGPAIASHGTSVAIAWFTAAAERPRVRLAFSTDGAATFAPAVDVDPDRPIGHVGVALADEQTAFVSWWARGSGKGAVLAARRVSASGGLGPVTAVATSSSTHPDDVPQMTLAAGALLFAWTDSSDPNGVRTAIADIGDL